MVLSVLLSFINDTNIARARAFLYLCVLSCQPCVLRKQCSNVLISMQYELARIYLQWKVADATTAADDDGAGPWLDK